MNNSKLHLRKRRQARIRSRVSGTATRPRLAVYRSNMNIYAQLIDDEKGVTIAAANDLSEKGGTKVERATKVGKAIAEAATKANIKECVFDRGGFLYTGRVKSLADSARASGLTF